MDVLSQLVIVVVVVVVLPHQSVVVLVLVVVLGAYAILTKWVTGETEMGRGEHARLSLVAIHV